MRGNACRISDRMHKGTDWICPSKHLQRVTQTFKTHSTVRGGGWPGYDSIVHGKKVSRQRPRSAMPWKTMGKSGLEPAAPNRLANRKHCALSTQPIPIGVSFECLHQHYPWSPVSIGKPAPKIHQWTIYFCRWGFGWVDKCSASDRLGDLVPQVRARTSPGFFTAWRF